MVREATNDGRDRRIAILVSIAGYPLASRSGAIANVPDIGFVQIETCAAQKKASRHPAAAALDGINARETHVDLRSFCHWTPASNTERAVHSCVFRDAQPSCGKLSHARFWRVFASLPGLCRGQSWLGQSPKRCACVAGWNVCTTPSKDVIRVADLGGDNLDDCLGVARIYFCALRNVETSSHSDCDLKSARPKIAAA